jgi:malate dehydrogenase (oxaloacetate-decarboxylating)(NADP+)
MQRRYYPFSRLSGPANILVMPGLQSASISAKLLKELGGESVLGPYLLGLELPVQIAPMTASASDLVTLAVLAAGDAIRSRRAKRGEDAPRGSAPWQLAAYPRLGAQLVDFVTGLG